MGRGSLTSEEIQILKDNPYVLDVMDSRIIYTREFKVHFMNEYSSGKKPTQIFRDAGFDTKILGSKRIERAAANWKESYASNSFGMYHGQKLRSVELEEENQQKIAELQQEIETLQKQVKILSGILGIE